MNTYDLYENYKNLLFAIAQQAYKDTIMAARKCQRVEKKGNRREIEIAYDELENLLKWFEGLGWRDRIEGNLKEQFKNLHFHTNDTKIK